MRRLTLIALLTVVAFICLSFFSTNNAVTGNTLNDRTIATLHADSNNNSNYNLYHFLGLDSLGLGQKAYELAVHGWEKLKENGQISRTSIMTIADFSQPSAQKRLYVIDMESGKLLYNTYVAHGRNSGRELATNYSNRPSSYQSSPGFYRTEDSYYGSNGYSLRLEGLEKGINDNADRRAIVVHGAPYVNENFIRQQGYIGRSQGCPAIPVELARPIINTIKGGSCLFIYAPVPTYAQRSRLIR